MIELSHTYDDLLMETVLNEIEAFSENSRRQCNIITMNESVTGFDKYYLLDKNRSVIIGNTFGGLDYEYFTFRLRQMGIIHRLVFG